MLTTPDHEADHQPVSMTDLTTGANYLDPCLGVIATVNTAASFETLGASLDPVHGVVGTTRVESDATVIH